MIKDKLMYEKFLEKSSKEYVKSRIREELIKLNYNFKYTGTIYLVETIYLLYSQKKYYKFSLESEVYPIIAKEYNCSVNTVKSNIVNATDKMCYDCEENKLARYIGKYKITKPGPKQIAKSVLKRIKDL